MLEHLGHQDAANAIVEAVEKTLANEIHRTPDLGGNASTVQCGDAVVAAILG
jgi:tartrate dehydrogenase/decarboxylase/D-malate dehydrogenase